MKTIPLKIIGTPTNYGNALWSLHVQNNSTEQLPVMSDNKIQIQTEMAISNHWLVVNQSLLCWFGWIGSLSWWNIHLWPSLYLQAEAARLWASLVEYMMPSISTQEIAVIPGKFPTVLNYIVISFILYRSYKGHRPSVFFILNAPHQKKRDFAT